MTLDDLREAFPDLGFGVYCYDPRGPVTLEVHAAEGLFSFRGATEAEAIAAAFPTEALPQPKEEPHEDIFS